MKFGIQLWYAFLTYTVLVFVQLHIYPYIKFFLRQVRVHAWHQQCVKYWKKLKFIIYIDILSTFTGSRMDFDHNCNHWIFPYYGKFLANPKILLAVKVYTIELGKSILWNNFLPTQVISDYGRHFNYLKSLINTVVCGLKLSLYNMLCH